MSEENVDVVRGQFAALGRGDLDAAAKFWHPEIEWRAVEGAVDDVGFMRGQDALRRYYRDWLDTFDELDANVEEVIFEAAGEVALVVRNSGRGRASGAPSEGRYYVTCTVRDGLIESGREYATRAQALEAVERSDQAMSVENVERAQRVYAATRTFLERASAGEDIGDGPGWSTLWDPDAVLVEIAEYPDAGSYRGHEELQRWIQGWLDAFDEISIEPLEFIPVGDHVVVPTHQRFRSKAGLDVEQQITQVLRFRGGKVIYATGYRDKVDALEAVGGSV